MRTQYDIVIELLDARIPIASRNPDIYAITKNKKKIILLNKADLSDPKTNEQWVNYFSKEAPTILTDASTGKGINKISSTINELMQDVIKRVLNKNGIQIKNDILVIYNIKNIKLDVPIGEYDFNSSLFKNIGFKRIINKVNSSFNPCLISFISM